MFKFVTRIIAIFAIYLFTSVLDLSFYAVMDIISKTPYDPVISNLTEQKIVREQIIEPNSAGTWYIPDVGVDIPIYNSNSQATVDAPNSAAYFLYHSACYMIVDHNYQGFKAIQSCTPGMKAMLLTEFSETDYVCIDITTGTNTGKGIFDSHGNDISHIYTSSDYIVCYTCNNNPQDVTIVIFEVCQPTKAAA